MANGSRDGVWPAYAAKYPLAGFDLGGGTFDVTVLEYATPVMKLTPPLAITSSVAKILPICGR